MAPGQRAIDALYDAFMENESNPSITPITSLVHQGHPYRTQAIVLRDPEPDKKLSGLLIVPNPVVMERAAPKLVPPSPHNCNLPHLGFTYRMLALFGILPSVRQGDLWRCAECKTIYACNIWSGFKFKDKRGSHYKCQHRLTQCTVFCGYWVVVDDERWLSEGGSIE